MKNIKVLGTGCSKCIKTAEMIEKLAAQMNVSVTVTKETDPETIMGYGIMSTPAVVIDEEVVHSGSMPHTEQIRKWLNEA